jgi:hypothetical protein
MPVKSVAKTSAKRSVRGVTNRGRIVGDVRATCLLIRTRVHPRLDQSSRHCMRLRICAECARIGEKLEMQRNRAAVRYTASIGPVSVAL